MLKRILRLLGRHTPPPEPPPAPPHVDLRKLYIRLFHGRKSPDEHLEDWGSDGPLIGPLQVSYTYGHIKIHSEWWDHFEHLVEIDGLVPFEGVYYGDFEICQLSGEDIFEAVRGGTETRTVEQLHDSILLEEAKLREAKEKQRNQPTPTV